MDSRNLFAAASYVSLVIFASERVRKIRNLLFKAFLPAKCAKEREK
jgi:hypothetical protein